MQAFYVLFLSLFSVTIAQPWGWSANFNMTTDVPDSGIVSGSAKWRWDPTNSNPLSRFNFELTFHPHEVTQTNTEYYQYNGDGGYSGLVSGQNKFLAESGCDCKTTGISGDKPAMPPLAPQRLAASYYVNPPAKTLTTCQLYTPKTKSIVSSFTAKPNTGEICSFTITDECTTRTFTLYDFSTSVPTLPIPPNCKCNSQLDVIIVMDQSQSITATQQTDFRKFIVDFLNSLDIGPNKVQVGMVWFNTNSERLFALESSTVNVAKGISSCLDSNNKNPDIGECTPNGVVWKVPCSGSTPAMCKSRAATNTMSGVLLGAAVLYGTNSRKVPKLFVTLTDGAVNVHMNGNTGVPWTNQQVGPGKTSSCNYLTASDHCMTELQQVMNTVRAQHARWASDNQCASGQCDLTFVSVGIGKTCTNDPNSCLSTRHLDLLAGGAGELNAVNDHALMVTDFKKLTGDDFLPKLGALVCAPDYFDCQKAKSCTGQWSGSCGTCYPPESCVPVNNTCYSIASQPILPLGPGGIASCPQTPKSCPSATPTCKASFHYNCVPEANNGKGECQKVADNNIVTCPKIPGSCAKTVCQNDGSCSGVDISDCPECGWVNSSCIGASCNPAKDGVITSTRTRTGDYCRNEGDKTTYSCCKACDCQPGPWTSWSDECADVCTTSQIITRSREIIPPTCGGSSTPCNGIERDQTIDCEDCTPVPCQWEWAEWICNCASRIARRIPIILVEDDHGGEPPCPGPQETSCTCCESDWTETDCDCDTNTLTRTWGITVPKDGSGYDCDVPDPSELILLCPPEGPDCIICADASDCDDGLACTNDICDTNDGTTTEKHCRHTPTVCNASTFCTDTVCDENKGGCYSTPSINALCDDNSVCTDDRCDDASESCIYEPSALAKSCLTADNINDCNIGICDPFVGCTFINLQCNSTENCTLSGCDPDWNSTDPDYEPLCDCADEGGPTGPCYSYPICGIDTGLVVGLTAGSIAAVVVCAAFGAGLVLSGGTYALASQVATTEDTNMNNNPLYQDKGTHGTNVLHAGAD